MTRRSFFKSLSSAVVGCYLAVKVKLPETNFLSRSLEDQELYHNLPYFIIKYDVKPLKLKHWTSNMGSVIRAVRKKEL